MEIAKLVLEYLKAFIWPALILVLVMMFRQSIRDRLAHLERLNVLGTEASFLAVQELKLAQDELMQVDPQPVITESSPPGPSEGIPPDEDLADRAKYPLSLISRLSSKLENEEDVSSAHIAALASVNVLLKAFDYPIAGSGGFSHQAAEFMLRRTHVSGWHELAGVWSVVAERPYRIEHSALRLLLLSGPRYTDVAKQYILTVRIFLERLHAQLLVVQKTHTRDKKG